MRYSLRVTDLSSPFGSMCYTLRPWVTDRLLTCKGPFGTPSRNHEGPWITALRATALNKFIINVGHIWWNFISLTFLLSELYSCRTVHTRHMHAQHARAHAWPMHALMCPLFGFPHNSIKHKIYWFRATVYFCMHMMIKKCTAFQLWQWMCPLTTDNA